jgi:cytochrome b561
MDQRENLMKPVPQTYSPTQIMLHWAVVALIAFQYLGSGGMEHAWRAYARGEYTQDDFSGLALAHIVSGVTVLVLVIWRLALRWKVGAPPPDPAEPRALQMLARIAHFALYALIIILPLSGMAGWGGGLTSAIRVHLLAKTILLPLIGLHVLGALVHHFVWKTNVLKRMLSPARADRLQPPRSEPM